MRLIHFLSFALLVGAVACGGDTAPEGTPPALDSVSVSVPVTGAASDSAARDSGTSAEATAERPAAPPAGVGDSAPPASPPASAGGGAPPPAATQDAAAILRRTAEVYQGIRSMRADFTMVVENALLRSSTTSRGTLYQRRPDRILLDFSEPEGDVIVSDGTYFWIYYPSVNADQVIRSPAAQAGAGGVDLQAQFVGDPTTRFAYTLEGSEAVDGRRAHVFTLVPRDNAGYRQLKVWIDAEDSLVRKFELTEMNGTVRQFEFSALVRNPTLGDERFRFTPPPNARVITR